MDKVDTHFTQQEKNHYDRQARNVHETPAAAYETFQKNLLRSATRDAYLAWKAAVAEKSANEILDYCAGIGYHTITLQADQPRADVTAIDISEVALEWGRKTASEILHGKLPRFIPMDAHALEFEAEKFDLVSDFGSFSSLDLDKAISEIYRVLKPGGRLVAIETFGHNPLTNLKRRWNVSRGSRTSWAATHILTSAHLQKIAAHFKTIEVRYFGLTALLHGLSPIKIPKLLSILEAIDRKLLQPKNRLSKYAFKVVIVATK